MGLYLRETQKMTEKLPVVKARHFEQDNKLSIVIIHSIKYIFLFYTAINNCLINKQIEERDKFPMQNFKYFM